MVEPIDRFEAELKEQLQLREAPAGFADRVMARIPARREGRHPWAPVVRWATAAVLVGAVVAGGVEHDRRQRIEGERARAEVLLALHITGTTLNAVERRIQADGASERSQQNAEGTDEQQ
ncbi:MAG TPA: hypothetical protein VHX37_08545 [Acidobacteriaceae bacterium]|nr:hypothetical protein [Acidobacteriaceae bacterium]